MDLLVPGGLTQEWLDRHLCTQALGDHAQRTRRELTGFSLGSRESPIYVRIYDKTREIHEQSQKWWFWDIWDARYRQDVWRIEFELKRDFFRTVRPSIDTVAALLPRLPDLWDYLTGTYLTFRADTGARMARRPILPLSETIRAQGRQWLGATGPATPVDRRHGRQGSWEHARRDQRRLIVRACAMQNVDTPEAVIPLLTDHLVTPEERDDFLRDVQRKRRALCVKPVPVHPAIGEVQS